MEIFNITIIWNGELREFPNVTNVEHGKGYVHFKDGKIHRHFSGVPYEIEYYFPGDKTEELPDDTIKWQKRVQAPAWLFFVVLKTINIIPLLII